ncbi:MAG: cyclic nucleotide-binding domain-containing protein, partial [Deltaproteobacteria bacterium]|nr:cyclic nucleotide-binding domain-containing protein [Deltaproteobacteria bacterium]
MFGRPKARKLKDQAAAAVSKGKYKKALEAYLELERIESSGDWSRRVGEVYKNLDQAGDAVAAYSRAVDRYAEAGFLVKALAVCNMILRIDPAHTDAQRRLVALNAARGIHIQTQADDTVEVNPSVASAAAPEPPPVDAKPRTRTLPSGAAIEEISLARSVPGSVSVPDLAAGEDSTDKAFEIPIELDFDEDREVESDSQEAREALEETPLFSELPPPVLHALIPKVRLVELEAGDVLFKQGDAGSELFVVAEGEVAVVDEGPPRVHLTKLGEGEFFGEVSLVTSQPRNATIEATETTEVLGISREVVSDLVEQEPAVLKVMLRFLRDRLINNLVRSNSLFQPFAAGERESLASKFRFLEV